MADESTDVQPKSLLCYQIGMIPKSGCITRRHWFVLSVQYSNIGTALKLRHSVQDKPVNADVDAASLAKRTAGFSGAELSNLVNEAALAAGKRGLPKITCALLDDAQDKVLMGSERRCASCQRA